MSNYIDPYPENAKLAAEKGYDRHLYLEQLGIPLNRCGVNFLDNTDERYQDWKEFKNLYNVDPRTTWNLNDAYVQWIYENVKAYKELAKNTVDLTFAEIKIEGETYTQLQGIDMILTECEEFFKYDVVANRYIVDDDVLVNTAKKITNIFIKLLPYMWW